MAEKEVLFALLTEVKEYDKPLFQHDLTFGRMIDDIIIPYETNEPFFIDGVPITRDKIVKIKIVKQGEYFKSIFYNFHGSLRNSDKKEMEILGNQYHIRLEAILRETGEDVTSQMIKAYNTAIKPKLKDYLNAVTKPEIISAGFNLFTEGIKLLGSHQ